MRYPTVDRAIHAEDITFSDTSDAKVRGAVLRRGSKA